MEVYKFFIKKRFDEARESKDALIRAKAILGMFIGLGFLPFELGFRAMIGLERIDQKKYRTNKKS